MNTTIFQCIVGLLACWTLAPVVLAAERAASLDTVLFLTRPEGALPGLDALEGTLRNRYGVSGPFAEHAQPGENAVEAQIFSAMRAVPPGGSLLVVVDLELIDRGAGGRILRTPDFDADVPFSGLPLLSLRRLSTRPIAGSMILVFPECVGAETGKGQTVAPATEPSSRSPLTLITFCPSTESARQDVYRTLAELMDGIAVESAGSPRIAFHDVGKLLADKLPSEHVVSETVAGGAWLRLPESRVEASLDGTGLHSRAAEVRKSGATSTGSPPDEETLRAANDPEPEVRREAIVVLGRAKDSSQVMAALQYALKDEDAEVREAAVYAIGQHWGMRTAPADDADASAVKSLTNDPKHSVRAGAYWALAKGRRHEIAPELRRTASDDPSPTMRMAALEALVELPAPENVQILASIARNTDVPVGQRTAAMRALTRVDTTESAEVLLELVVDPQLSVSSAATKYVGAMGSSPPSARALALDSATRLDQRQLAIRLVGREESTASAQLLLNLLLDNDPDVQAEAAVALRTQTQFETTQAVVAILKNATLLDQQRVSAAKALQGTTSADAFDALEDATKKNESPEVREAALTTLPTAQVTPSRTRIYDRAAQDKNSQVRVAAVAGLDVRMSRIPSNDSDAATRKSLERLATKSEDAQVREAASESLRISASRRRFLEELGEANAPQDDASTLSDGDRRNWWVDIFWCDGERGPELNQRALKLQVELARFAETTRDGPNVFDPARFRTRPISVETNAQPGYQLASDEVRYDAGNPIEALWAQRLLLYAGPTFTTKAVRTVTPNYLSIFVCSTSAVP